MACAEEEPRDEPRERVAEGEVAFRRRRGRAAERRELVEDRRVQRAARGEEAGARRLHVGPRLRLLVVGAVHITAALVPMARAADYDVVLMDVALPGINGVEATR